MDWLAYENAALSEGYTLVCGIDEAGRGPLAGPVCAACVVLPQGAVLEGVNDSKKLTEKKREALYDVIKDRALDYGIAFADEKEIDEINILQATFLAMRRAFEQLSIVTPDIALIDGNKTPGLPIAERFVIKGDAKSANIAAASILAKVTRDRYMLEMAQKYPQYLFEKHKGYGTKDHYAMIERYGICEIHRKTFLKKLLENESDR